MKDGIPHRNHSPHGWWIATYIERTEWDDAQAQPDDVCLAWENTIILTAVDREAAYAKVVAMVGTPTSQFMDDTQAPPRAGHWVFEGLTSLLPIYDKLEDGAEVLWIEHEDKTLRDIQSWIKSKSELEVFDDTPAIGDSA